MYIYINTSYMYLYIYIHLHEEYMYLIEATLKPTTHESRQLGAAPHGVRTRERHNVAVREALRFATRHAQRTMAPALINLQRPDP